MNESGSTKEVIQKPEDVSENAGSDTTESGLDRIKEER